LAHQPLIGRRSVEINFDKVPSVFVDPTRILQVLSNLISNAVKFTADSGKLRISLEAKDGFVSIAVQDDGIGISDKDIPKLFKKFSQVGEGFSHGTGLGLALCKQLVELHGGSIRVESTLGKGSTFTFSLPASKTI
jgi:signal transduction histidine kinase